MLDKEPSAIITVAGSEKKIYQDGQIFLNNGENFEIRFFNPLQTKIGVEILFDGQKKNNGLLVLKPGEDVILDRFLDDKRKMLYETYTIDGNNSAAKEAAALNGLIQINFYKEKSYNSYYSSQKCNFSGNVKSCGCKSRGIGGQQLNSSAANNSWSPITPPEISTTEVDEFYDYSQDDVIYGSSFNNESIGCCDTFDYIDQKNLIETGRIEKGPESKQDLKIVNVDFDPLAFHTIKYQLKPTSQMNDNIAEIRQYCPYCSYRLRKKNWVFCPKCGEKID
jgi:hypothetical protein